MARFSERERSVCSSTKGDGRLVWLAVALAIGPFVFKRIILIGHHDYVFWVTVDYLARCVSLAGVALSFRCGLIERSPFRAGWIISAIALVALLITELAEQTFVYPVLQTHLNYLKLSFLYQIPGGALRAADLTVGLLLVAFSEELVFRRLLFSIIPSKSFLIVTLTSAFIFALIHLTSGLADAANALVMGILLGGAYWVTRRISICIVAHYLIDLKVFGGF